MFVIVGVHLYRALDDNFPTECTLNLNLLTLNALLGSLYAVYLIQCLSYRYGKLVSVHRNIVSGYANQLDMKAECSFVMEKLERRHNLVLWVSI